MRTKATMDNRPISFADRLGLGGFVVAAIIYAGFSVYLYYPHIGSSDRWKCLLIVNACLACLGGYLLSRRWVAAFSGSLFAGAVYGFGPFLLGLAKFHPTAGLLVASIPWLFCPAAFGPRTRWRHISPALVALPFLMIVVFFQVSAHYRLFPVPTQTSLRPPALVGLLAPLVVAERDTSTTLIGFYHIPIASILMGLWMLLAARRIGVLAIFALGTVLACCQPVLNVSPVIWLAIPALCCSILVGVGMQGIASAGFADRKWVLLAAIIMGILAIVTLMLATEYFQTLLALGSKYAGILAQTAKMYVLGATSLAIIFFIERAKLRVPALRWTILCTTMALDTFIGARFVIGTVL